MKLVTEQDVLALAGQLERLAKTLRKDGPLAVRRARDYASPLRSSGTDPGRGKGGHSDPTASAAFARPRTDEERERAKAAEEMTLLWIDTDMTSKNAYSLEHRVTRLVTDAVVENQRAGIGHCANEDCNRYCDGSPNNRLRLGICDACRKREERKEPKCRHFKSKWSDGVRVCMNDACQAVLTEAGVEVG